MPKDTINANGLQIGIYTNDFNNEFISLTDIARYRNIKDPRFIIRSWMRNKDVVEFLGLWEILHNPNFKRVEFDTFKNEAGKNSFVISPELWVKNTNAIGIVNKRGRYDGGTYAHSDIAFEFASWISAEFKLYIIKDYHRLKNDENSRLSLNWNLNREVFGQTAKEWRESNKDKTGNIRDYATINQLLVLANIESYNAILINQDQPQSERLVLLREMVKQQLKTISERRLIGKLK